MLGQDLILTSITLVPTTGRLPAVLEASGRKARDHSEHCLHAAIDNTRQAYGRALGSFFANLEDGGRERAQGVATIDVCDYLGAAKANGHSTAALLDPPVSSNPPAVSTIEFAAGALNATPALRSRLTTSIWPTAALQKRSTAEPSHQPKPQNQRTSSAPSAAPHSPREKRFLVGVLLNSAGRSKPSKAMARKSG